MNKKASLIKADSTSNCNCQGGIRGEECFIRTNLFDLLFNVGYHSYKNPHYGGAT